MIRLMAVGQRRAQGIAPREHIGAQGNRIGTAMPMAAGHDVSGQGRQRGRIAMTRMAPPQQGQSAGSNAGRDGRRGLLDPGVMVVRAHAGGRGDGLADEDQPGAPVAVGEEAEVADAVEAVRQRVQQEAADELGWMQASSRAPRCHGDNRASGRRRRHHRG